MYGFTLLLLIPFAALPVLLAFFHSTPYVKAGIYTSVKILILFIVRPDIFEALIHAMIVFIAAFVYFTILRRLDSSIVFWFFAVIFGALLLAVI